MSGGKTAREHGRSEIVVYGRHAVLEALAASDTEIRELRIARDVAKPLRTELERACRAHGVAYSLQSRRAVAELSRDARNDQGLAARVWLGGVCDIDAFLAERSGRAAREPTRLLAFDGLTNSQNVGMIVRSAVAAGVDGIVWPLHGTPWINGLVVKASAGSVFRARVLRCDTLALGLGTLRGGGFHMIGLAPEGGADLFDLEPKHRSVVIVGNESHGLSQDTDPLLDQRARIPLSGEVESLNAAVAASLAAFWLCGRLGQRSG